MGDFRDRDAHAPAKLRKRGALRYELRAQYRRKNLEHQPVEGDDKIGAGQERMGIGMRQPVATRDVECGR
jgi:hypothetical protein